jgi:hypothetical protein
MTNQATYYVVRVNAGPEHDGCPRDAFFGYEPTVYLNQEDAELRARLLSNTGDWGQCEPPKYFVQECIERELESAELSELEKME